MIDIFGYQSNIQNENETFVFNKIKQASSTQCIVNCSNVMDAGC